MGDADGIRQAIEAAKVTLMDWQQSARGPDSVAISVECFEHLDRAWAAAVRMQERRSFGR